MARTASAAPATVRASALLEHAHDLDVVLVLVLAGLTAQKDREMVSVGEAPPYEVLGLTRRQRRCWVRLQRG